MGCGPSHMNRVGLVPVVQRSLVDGYSVSDMGNPICVVEWDSERVGKLDLQLDNTIINL